MVTDRTIGEPFAMPLDPWTATTAGHGPSPLGSKHSIVISAPADSIVSRRSRI
jgi:hypothetical protein